ncbi:hypothetical protein [Nitrosomonas ureae]|uniref:Uncharacterized protein n=1 Tax=Nitrosomonas ureae TaxID=44577 RepID=A0A1H5SP68_9PROT|nr:hypothetical protein [Nitrosomonas ureae]SEF52403.1 hypothetical protein SAMN05216334_1037 [Nitrosomonas ureae]
MNNGKFIFQKVFRRLARAIDRLSEDDLSKLSDDSYNIEIRFTRKRNRDETINQVNEIDLVDVINKLIAFPNREEAQRFLDTHYCTRKSVEPIARKLDIPISRQDKLEILRDKIIEATVGARIRSQAIQGDSVR